MQGLATNWTLYPRRMQALSTNEADRLHHLHVGIALLQTLTLLKEALSRPWQDCTAVCATCRAAAAFGFRRQTQRLALAAAALAVGDDIDVAAGQQALNEWQQQLWRDSGCIRAAIAKCSVHPAGSARCTCWICQCNSGANDVSIFIERF